MGKKIKKYIIAAIAGVVIGELVWLVVIGGISIYAMDQAEIIDMDDLFGISSGGSKSYGVNSPTVNGMLKACQEIANYYKDHNYTYDKEAGGWTEDYRQQTVRTSCCSIYVLQVLINCGLTDTLGGQDVWYVWELLDSDPNWERIDAKDDSDLRPRRYSNI